MEWYSPNHTLTHNAFINMVIGQRGAGKTYGTKCFCVKKWLQTGAEFMYVRRNQKELDMVKDKLFADTDYPIVCKGDVYWYKTDDGQQVCGWAIPLSTSSKYKSAPFPKVKYIVFDEFIIDPSKNERYLKNEVDTFLNLLETVVRMRNDCRVIMLANSLSFVNPYTLYWGLRKCGTYSKTRDGLVLLELYYSDKYKEEKEKSVIGKLTKGSRYAEMAVDNRFILDSDDFVCKRKGQWQSFCGIVLEGHEFGVWKSGNTFHVDKKMGHDIVYCVEQFDIREGRIFQRKPPCFASVAKALKEGGVTFENVECKALFLRFISKYV